MNTAAGGGHTPPKEIAKVMNKDESLLWFDHPGAGAFAQTRLKSLMMSIPFFVFAFIWFNIFMKPDMPAYMSVLGWAFIAFGVWHFFVPVWAFMIARFFMFYAITDSRILIIQFYPKSKVRAIVTKDVVNIINLKGPGNTGTLIFEIPDLNNKKATKEGQFVKAAGTFYGINNVKRVEAAIDQLRGAASPGPKPPAAKS